MTIMQLLCINYIFSGKMCKKKSPNLPSSFFVHKKTKSMTIMASFPQNITTAPEAQNAENVPLENHGAIWISHSHYSSWPLWLWKFKKNIQKMTSSLYFTSFYRLLRILDLSPTHCFLHLFWRFHNSPSFYRTLCACIKGTWSWFRLRWIIPLLPL